MDWPLRRLRSPDGVIMAHGIGDTAPASRYNKLPYSSLSCEEMLVWTFQVVQDRLQGFGAHSMVYQDSLIVRDAGALP